MQRTDPKFEILKEMASFTEEMFNQIIAFQEKQHSAWNNTLSFDKRIKNLPLHYLVFSNADRNPATHGPTVAHFYPLREEFVKIIHYAKQVADIPVICDLHARNGFIGSLLAREGGKETHVIGLRDKDDKPNQIEEFFDTAHYKYFDSNPDQLEYDVAFSSWMPSEKNFTPIIILKKPKLIVFVYTNHTDNVTGIRQTGTDDSFTALPEQYKLIDKWTIDRPKDLFSDIWPDLSPSLKEKRHVRVYADRTIGNILPYTSTSTFKLYDWEKELRMALTALEAKHTLRNSGFPV